MKSERYQDRWKRILCVWSFSNHPANRETAKTYLVNNVCTKELGKTLREVRDMTLDELIGWSSYFQVINEEQEKEFEKAKRRR